MKSFLAVLAAAAVIGLASPAWAGHRDGSYRVEHRTPTYQEMTNSQGQYKWTTEIVSSGKHWYVHHVKVAVK